MKQKNTESKAVRRRGAVRSAVISTLYRLLMVAVLLWLRTSLDPAGFFAKLMLILILPDIGSILLIWISLKQRLKEIEGGEEDAAAQY